MLNKNYHLSLRRKKNNKIAVKISGKRTIYPSDLMSMQRAAPKWMVNSADDRSNMLMHKNIGCVTLDKHGGIIIQDPR